MDTLPAQGSPINSPKRKPMKFKNIEDPLSYGSNLSDTSTLVSFVPLRTASSKTSTSTKKPVENAKKLKKRLNEISEENETLTRQIDDKNREIDELKRSVQSLNDVLESVPLDQMRTDTSIAARQILELSKKNRQYRTELDAKKVLIQKRDLQIQKLEKELLAIKEKQDQDVGDAQKGGKALADLQAKLSALQQKWFETRNRNVELQEKLKLAGKCLQQEIGDSFDLSKLNSFAAQTGSNWRGRAQQILHLQQTINELKARIEMLEQMASPAQMSSFVCDTLDTLSVNSSNMNEDLTVTQQTEKAQQKFKSTRSIRSAISFDRVSPCVRKSELMHRAKVEELEKTIAELKAQLDEQRGKILALKVRNKTLNEDMLKYKAKAASYDFTDYNGMNLQALNEQMLQQKNEYEGRIELMNRELKELRERCESHKTNEEELQAKLANTEKALAQTEAYLRDAQDTIRKLEQDMKSICGDFLFSCRELRKEEFVAILDSLETEKNFLLEQTKTLKMRLNEERTKTEGMSETLGKQKLRIARLEGRIKELEKEIETTGEKKKRLQRITDYASNLTAKTGGSVQSIVFESTSRSSSSTACNEQQLTHEMGELRQKLEIANEKIIMLEDRLTYLNSEKERDAKNFEQALTNSKSAIVETILSYRGEHDSLNENTNIRSLSFDRDISKAMGASTPALS